MTTRQKVLLKTCNAGSQQRTDVEALFQSEWSDFNFDEVYTSGADLPPVIVAISDEQVIGGLAYSRYLEPNGSAEVIWLNAVYVCKGWRGQGIASQLIKHGVSQVTSILQSSIPESSISQRHLYAYTDVPKMYTSLGWSAVDTESEPNHSVMRIALEA